MPGISITNIDIKSQNAFASSYGYSNYGYGYDDYGYGYDDYRYTSYGYSNYGYGYDDYGYGYSDYEYKSVNYAYENNDYNKKYESNKKEQYSDYTYSEYKKNKQTSKNIAQIERYDDKLFVCDNGIVVDDRTQCPLKCPFGTTLDGAYVMDLEICDIEPGTASKKCPQGTDLEGVLVMNKNQCDIFAECDASSPLGISLGALQPVTVADVQLCQLSIPDLEICNSGFFAGFAVTDLSVCITELDQVQICQVTSDLSGVLTTNINSCNIFSECDANSELGMALGNTAVKVADSALCNLEIPDEVDLFTCELDTLMGIAGGDSAVIVTDPLLCQSPNDGNKCPAETDLAGVYVSNIASDCNIFTTCDAGTPLGMALGDQSVKVADEVLCDLEIPQVTPAGFNLPMP